MIDKFKLTLEQKEKEIANISQQYKKSLNEKISQKNDSDTLNTSTKFTNSMNVNTRNQLESEIHDANKDVEHIIG